MTGPAAGAPGTLYDLLGVPVDAEPAQITSAYRKAARRLHPDVNPDADPAELAAISDAYAVLSKATSRAAYDTEAGLTGRRGTGPVSEPQTPQTGLRWRQDGLDVHTQVRVSAAQAATGVEVLVPVAYAQPCRSCRGAGFDIDQLTRVCPGCSGVRMHPVTGVACGQCVGLGSVSDQPCPDCGGERAIPVAEEVRATVPPGTRPGTRLRLTRKGAAALDGRGRGTVYVEVLCDPDTAGAADPDLSTAGMDGPGPGGGAPDEGTTVRAGSDPAAFVFAANGADVGLSVPVTYPELRLGAELVVADPHGARHRVTVPAGTVPETVLRVPGAGRASVGGGPADLHLQLVLRMPTGTPTDDEATALRALADVTPLQP